MHDELAPARAVLSGYELADAATLSEGERSTVRRVSAIDPGGAVRWLIVKEYHTDDEGWVRESAALASVPGAVRVPALVAVGSDPRVVVMEDLGDGPNVADALLGDDPAVAADAVCGWAVALAELHVATRGSRAHFRVALDERAPGAEIAESWMPTGLREAERVLDRDCGSLGVTIPSGALDELVGLASRLGGDGPAALTPADACPDNNVRLGDRSVLIDFEGAEWRHLAWDLAYLRVPWPTCWCSWALPGEVSERALVEYRDVAAGAFPELSGAEFAADVDAAVAGWSLMTASWFIDHAIGSELDVDSRLHPDRPSPTRRQNIMHRLAVASGCTALPALGELAGNLRDVLARRWDDAELELAPAFRV